MLLVNLWTFSSSGLAGESSASSLSCPDFRMDWKLFKLGRKCKRGLSGRHSPDAEKNSGPPVSAGPYRTCSPAAPPCGRRERAVPRQRCAGRSAPPSAGTSLRSIAGRPGDPADMPIHRAVLIGAAMEPQMGCNPGTDKGNLHSSPGETHIHQLLDLLIRHGVIHASTLMW